MKIKISNSLFLKKIKKKKNCLLLIFIFFSLIDFVEVFNRT